MRCHVCNVEVGDGQKFCHECGESLAGVTLRTQPVPVVPGLVDDDANDDANDGGADDDEITVERLVDRDTSADDDDIVATPTHAMATEQIDVTAAAEPTAEIDAQPSEAPSRQTDTKPAAASLETEPITIVEATPVPPSVPPLDEAGSGAFAATAAGSAAAYEATTAIPAAGGPPPVRALGVTDEFAVAPTPIFDGIGDVAEYPAARDGFRLRASFVLGVLALVATLMASVADTIDIRTSRPVDGIDVGIKVLDDFNTNLAVGAYIGAGMLLVGALVSCFGFRWGAGLAGGAGLALLGWAAMTIGRVEVPIHRAEAITRTAADANGFSLSITRDLGWFLIAGVGVLGFLVFLVSLRMAGRGGQPGLNPWVAAVGAVGAVILTAGPLLPLGDATLESNLGFVGLPRAFFAGRLVQLAMIAFTGVVGFLSVRNYGLGMVAGGLGIAAWLWATSIAEIGEPIGVAIGNLGTSSTMPHAVTTVGLAVSAVMLAVAIALASAQRR